MPGDPAPLDFSAFASLGSPVALDGPKTDWEALSASYIAEARKIDALRIWEVMAAENPSLASTDWSRAHFNSNRAEIEQVLGWRISGKGLLLSGPTGRGKTRALFGLMHRLATEGVRVRYWYAGDWFSSLQRQVNYGRDDARGWVEAVAGLPMVILDDLGQEAIQHSREDWAQAWFFRFLDIRIAKGLPLIVSTNIGSQDMAERAGGIRSDPLIRRLMDLCAVVKFK